MSLTPGSTASLRLIAPGGPGTFVGEIMVMVLGSEADYIAPGAEVDVIVHPGEDLENVADLLERCDMTLDDIQVGPVYVLRNCQYADLTVIAANPVVS